MGSSDQATYDLQILFSPIFSKLILSLNNENNYSEENW